MTVTVIIPAAGLGTRMARGASTPGPGGDESSGTSRKQLMLLGDSPILIHTIRKFAACSLVTQIIVALRPEDASWVSVLIERENFTTPVHVVEGGDSRQESVRNALAAIGDTADLVAVHDAVRPFVDPATIENVIREAARCGAAIAGIVPIDTVKQVKGHRIRETLMRDHLILAQTPQIFRYALLKEAFDKAAAENFSGTDESSLVERLGHEVSVVPGSDRNIKITRPGDMELAKLFLAEELAAQSA
jgi:2-C-methyl-D-erythritol 4-phosphate cytidylyltransferase